MTVQRTPPPPPRGTRPRNRRQLIITAAADLLACNGYAQVSMADVADAVAVRPSALYRHFRGKDDLLYQAVRDMLTAVQVDLRGMASTRELAVTALDHRGIGVLWQRESRHLPRAARRRLRARLIAIAAQVAAFVARRRPDLREADRDLLAWACLDVATSISFQRIDLPRPEYTDLLAGIIDRVVDTDLDTDLPVFAPVIAAPPPPGDLDRRDELLAAAARLFAQRGYHSVGVDDVATAVGIAGPSIYHHFATKLDLIVAVITQGANQLLDSTARALADTHDDTQALNALLGAYTSFSLTNSDLMDVLITEVPHLPDPHRTTFRQTQRHYLDQWLDVLARLHPHLPPAHTRVHLQAALTVINDIARTPHLRTQPRAPATIAAIGHAILSPPTTSRQTGTAASLTVVFEQWTGRRSAPAMPGAPAGAAGETRLPAPRAAARLGGATRRPSRRTSVPDPPAPPGDLQARPATGADLEAVVALCRRCEVADLGEPDTGTDDVQAAWRRPGFDLARDTVLVLTSAGEVVGYGDVFDGREAFGMVDPGWRGRGIGAWLLRRIERLAREGRDGRTLEVSAPHADRAFRDLAERAGYRPGRSSWVMRLDMPEPPPAPAWPDEVALRPFVREADARAVHRLVQDAFVDIGNQPARSFEFWQRTNLERGDFDPSLWFLAVSGEELVGANLCFAGPSGGFVAQLAVRRDRRGQGLGLALLRHGFAELYRRGERQVWLYVDTQNRTGATRLYERAGMRVEHRFDFWVKRLG